MSPAKALDPIIRPLLCVTLQDILRILGKVFPHAEKSFQRQRQQGSVLPVGSIDKSAPRLKSNCVPLCSFSDVACDVLEDDLVLSAEEDAGDCRQTSLSQLRNPAAKELNFSRLVSCSIKECYLVGLVFRFSCWILLITYVLTS